MKQQHGATEVSPRGGEGETQIGRVEVWADWEWLTHLVSEPGSDKSATVALSGLTGVVLCLSVMSVSTEVKSEHRLCSYRTNRCVLRAEDFQNPCEGQYLILGMSQLWISVVS